MNTVSFTQIMKGKDGQEKLFIALDWLRDNWGPGGTGDRVMPYNRWNLRSDLCGIVFRDSEDMAYFILRWV